MPPTPNNVVLQDALIFCLLFYDFAERYDEQIELPFVRVASLVAKHFNKKRFTTEYHAANRTANQCRFDSDRVAPCFHFFHVINQSVKTYGLVT